MVKVRLAGGLKVCYSEREEEQLLLSSNLGMCGLPCR